MSVRPRVAFLAAFASIALASALSAQDRFGGGGANPDEAALVHDRTAFALALYRKAAGSGNVFLSPQSIWTCLAMVHAGATGETAKEITSALCMSVPVERLYRGNATASKKITRRGYDLRSGNGLFAQRGEALHEEFLSVLADRFGAPLQPLDFKGAPDASRSAINDWVAERTAGKIPALLGGDDVNEGTSIVLANAVYFAARWAQPFPKTGTKDGAFSSPKGDVTTALMHDTIGLPRAKGYRYAESETAQVLSIPYEGDEVSLVVILPTAKNTLEKVEAAITAEKLDKMCRQELQPLPALLQPRANPTIEITLPRFTLRWHGELSSLLGELGVKRVFSDGAELDGIFAKKRAKLRHVVHEAVIELDEQGTQAAAATAATGSFVFDDDGPPPPQPIRFVATRPFLFILRHNPTGLIFFMGRLVEPSR